MQAYRTFGEERAWDYLPPMSAGRTYAKANQETKNILRLQSLSRLRFCHVEQTPAWPAGRHRRSLQILRLSNGRRPPQTRTLFKRQVRIPPSPPVRRIRRARPAFEKTALNCYHKETILRLGGETGKHARLTVHYAECTVPRTLCGAGAKSFHANVLRLYPSTQ